MVSLHRPQSSQSQGCAVWDKTPSKTGWQLSEKGLDKRCDLRLRRARLDGRDHNFSCADGSGAPSARGTALWFNRGVGPKIQGFISGLFSSVCIDRLYQGESMMVTL